MTEEIRFKNLSGWLKFAAIMAWVYAGAIAYILLFWLI